MYESLRDNSALTSVKTNNGIMMYLTVSDLDGRAEVARAPLDVDDGARHQQARAVGCRLAHLADGVRVNRVNLTTTRDVTGVNESR